MDVDIYLLDELLVVLDKKIEEFIIDNLVKFVLENNK